MMGKRFVRSWFIPMKTVLRSNFGSTGSNDYFIESISIKRNDIGAIISGSFIYHFNRAARSIHLPIASEFQSCL